MPKDTRKLQQLGSRAAGKIGVPNLVVVAGAGANTNIAVAGIKRKDALVAAIEVPASAALVDRTSATSITSDGNIQCTAATTGNQLLVSYVSL